MTNAVIPADIQSALKADPAAGQAFDKLPASHQREYLRWVLEAKKADTRARRISGMVERLTSSLAQSC